MSTWDTGVEDHYYVGQGQVLLAERDSAGKPKGFVYLGNVSAFKLSIATTTLEHKESHTGQRGIDLRLTTETKASISLDLENFVADNLARALRGASTKKTGTTVTAEAVNGYKGKISALDKIKVSSVVVKQGATTLTAYVDDATPYDYKLNAEAGSIQINDGSVVAPANLGTAATAVAVGSTTTLTVANSAAAGETVYLRGFTGADAATLNGKTATIVSATSTQIVIDIDSTGDTITVGTNKVHFEKTVLAVDYTYATQYLVDALSSAAKNLWIRIEGLNTAESDAPTVIDVFKVPTDPLKELELIGDTVNKFTLEGSVLADNLRSSGSKYFSVKQLV